LKTGAAGIGSGMSNQKNPAAVALGRLGRAANTTAQQAAARKNGKKGGRPKGAKDSKPRKRSE